MKAMNLIALSGVITALLACMPAEKTSQPVLLEHASFVKMAGRDCAAIDPSGKKKVAHCATLKQ